MGRQPTRALEVIDYKNVNSNYVNEIKFQLQEGAGQNTAYRCCSEQQCEKKKNASTQTDRRTACNIHENVKAQLYP